MFVNNCPFQPYIPVFLIIGGLAGLIKIMLLITESVVRKRSASVLSRVHHPKLALWTWRIGNLAFNLLMLVWVVAGSYWIYGSFKHITSNEYASCDPFLYKFAFAFVTGSYIFLILMFSCMCFMAGTSLKKTTPREVGGENPTRSPSNQLPPPSLEATPPNPAPHPHPSRPNLNLDSEAPLNPQRLPVVVVEEEASLELPRRFGMGNGAQGMGSGPGMGNRSIENGHRVISSSTLASESGGRVAATVHGSMGSLTGPAAHSPLTTPTTTTLAGCYYHGNYNSRSHHNHQQLPPFDYELPGPTPSSAHALGSSPTYPCHQLHPFRQTSFSCSHDTCAQLRPPPLHTAASFSTMRGAKSSSPIITPQPQLPEAGNPAHKGMNRPCSSPHLLYDEESRSRVVEPRYGNLGDSMCESNCSSLYNTSHLDGFSITAV